jgi:starch synthase
MPKKPGPSSKSSESKPAVKPAAKKPVPGAAPAAVSKTASAKSAPPPDPGTPRAGARNAPSKAKSAPTAPQPDPDAPKITAPARSTPPAPKKSSPSKSVSPTPTVAPLTPIPAPVAPSIAPTEPAPKQSASTARDLSPAPLVAPLTPIPSPLAAPIAPTEAAPKAAKLRKSPPRIKGALRPAAPVVTTPGGEGHRILCISAECTPLAQSGGLGDAVAGLAKALLKRGNDVRIVMPLYGYLDRAKYGITFSRSCCVHFGQGEEIWVGIHEAKLDGQVPIWFIDYDRYFGGPYLYGGADDAYRFGLLSKAALQICKDVNFIPHVVHVHDWMSAMAAVFLKTWDRILSPLSNTASVLTIHNIGYQGKFDAGVLRFYGLGGDYMQPDRFEDFGMVNLLKAGVQYADAITTVSPTYAREVRAPLGGMGLAPYLNNRADHLFGILNGVDTSLWNPEIDKYIPARYSRTDLAGKAACKRALQERFGLEPDPNLPIFAMVSRFAPQKGFDLLRGALPEALRTMHLQVVALGAGDPITEDFFRWLNSAYPSRANAHIGFLPELAHLIEAGSDFFLMPSYYEPCGLNQMYSSLYGTLPVVRATGFKFWDISDRALYYTLGWAVSTWYDRPHHYRAMQQQGMARDFSWDASAREYEKVYAHAMAQRTGL